MNWESPGEHDPRVVWWLVDEPEGAWLWEKEPGLCEFLKFKIFLDQVIDLFYSFKGRCCLPTSLREFRQIMSNPKVCMCLSFMSVGGFELEWKVIIRKKYLSSDE